MSYKNYQWEIVAKDYNSSLFRNYLWVWGAYYFSKIHNTSRLFLGIISKNDNLEYLADLNSWQKVHEELKEKALKDDNFVEDLINQSHREGEKFNQWTEKSIFQADLKVRSGAELYHLVEKFIEWQGKIYALGIAIPIMDFQGFAFVEGFLNKYLKAHLNKKDFSEYYTIFTEPVANSFAQDQEEDLLKIMVKYWDNTAWQNDIKNKKLEDLREKYSSFYRDLIKHNEKYCWVYYVYNGPESTPEDFLNFIKDYLIKAEHPQKVLENIKIHQEEVIRKKKEFLEKYQPNDFEKKMLDLAGKFVWGKPRRKDYQSKSYYHAKKLQLEIAKRLNVSLSQMRSIPLNMLKVALVDNKEIDLKKINNIRKFHIVLPNDDGEISVLTDQDAEDFDKNIKRSHGDYKNKKEITGSTAFPGKVQGVVKIVNTVSDMSKMAYGDILISAQTSPSIIAAMKKAAAFVTDEGGLTCHAAIVSRELGKPCVVGTKIATVVFKDGDMVEVDANRGVVKKI